MIRVMCPTCRSQFDTADQYAGRTTNCPNCGGKIAIPAPAYAPPMGPACVPAQPLGYPGAAGPPAVPMMHGGLAVAGFVCGLVGFILSVIAAITLIIPCVYCVLAVVADVTALAGIVCSIIALVTAKKANRKKGLAIAGLVLAVLAFIWAPLTFFLMFGGLAAMGAAF